MVEVMTEKGYVETSVGDVLKRAVVSRQSFYQLFDSKFDCFIAAYDKAADLLLRRLLESVGGEGPNDPLARFERAVTAYLDALAEEWPYARLFLVEVYAAGPQAIRRRRETQDTLAGVFADVMGAGGDDARFTCQLVVAATSTMVTTAVAENDPGALRALGPRLIEHVRWLWHAGAFRDR